MKTGFNFPEGSTVEMTVSQGGRSASSRVERWGQAHDAVTGMGGRIAVSPVALPGAVRQHDGSYVLPLWDDLGASSRIVVRPDDAARKVALDIAASVQQRGWGDVGRHYMPERDADGRIVIEPGRNHRKVYVTLGPAGMTADAIASHAGVSVNDVSAAWLKARPQYGGSEDMPLLDGPLARDLWTALVRDMDGGLPKRQSHWLLFERGHDYSANGQVWRQDLRGESPLHPTLIDAWGKGAAPKLPMLEINAGAIGDPHYLVFRGVDMPKVSIIYGGRWLIFTEVETSKENVLQNESGKLEYITWHRSAALDVYREAPTADPQTGEDTWGGQRGKISGFYVSAIDHVLFEEVWGDMIGWRPGYDPSPTPPPGATPQPPSQFSHFIYGQTPDTAGVVPPVDLCCMDCMSSRNTDGPMLRPGATSVGTIVLDCNTCGSDVGGDYGSSGGPVGYYGLHIGMVATAGSLRTSATQAAQARGFGAHPGATVDRFVFAHSGLPDQAYPSLSKPDSYHRCRYAARRWSAEDHGLEGLDLDELDRTTIQNHAAAVLGQSEATIADYLTHLRGLTPQGRARAMAALREYFRRPFGMFVEPRAEPGEAIFMPSDATEGYRWEIDLNWVGTQPPIDGDEVDLWGNFVRFNRLTQAVASLRFRGALLEVVSGRLTVGAHADDARIAVSGCGQYVGPAGIEEAIAGGRRVFAGGTAGRVTVGGDAECLFGPSLAVGDLTITGGDCWAGWDGSGTASLTITGTLAFAAQNGRIGQLRRFRRRGDDPEPTVAASLVLEAGTRVEVDTTGLASGTWDLTGDGVTVIDQGALLPAGVTVAGGRLRVRVS